MSGAAYQAVVDRALGAIGRQLGKPYQVYRVESNSAGDFPAGWSLISTSTPVMRNRVSSNHLETSLLSERSLWYELAGDISPFILGDVFISADTAYSPGIGYGSGATILPGTTEIDAFALAWHAPMQDPIGARIDRRVGIYRPSLAPRIMSDGSRRWSTTHEQDTPLVLTGGTYAWGAPGAKASWVPCGLGSNDRQVRDGGFGTDKIGIVPASRYFAYLPPLPGYAPVEGDALITEHDARYVVLSPYVQQSGVVGAQMMIERMVSGTP